MKKRLCKWEGWEKVGIWDNVHWQVCLYDGFATIRRGYIKWRNNSGDLAEGRYRVTGRVYEKIRKIHKKDEVDNYVDEIYRLICEEGF